MNRKKGLHTGKRDSYGAYTPQSATLAPGASPLFYVVVIDGSDCDHVLGIVKARYTQPPFTGAVRLVGGRS